MPLPLIPIAIVAVAAWYKSKKEEESVPGPPPSDDAAKKIAAAQFTANIQNLRAPVIARTNNKAADIISTVLASGANLTGIPVVGGVVKTLSYQAVKTAQSGGTSIDQSLGGTGSGATGTVAQTFVGIGTLFSATAAVLFFPCFAIVYAVTSMVTDAEKLAYGQAGATVDLEKRRQEVRDQVAAKLQDMYPNASSADCLTVADIYSKSYVRTANRLSFDAWMREPHGLFVSDAYHARFGRDRGYFVGDVSDGGAFVETVTAGYGDVPTSSPITQAQAGEVVAQASDDANVTAYLEHMRSDPHGIGMNDQNHCRWGVEHGMYTGDAGPDSCDIGGNLLYHGVKVEWKR